MMNSCEAQRFSGHRRDPKRSQRPPTQTQRQGLQGVLWATRLKSHDDAFPKGPGMISVCHPCRALGLLEAPGGLRGRCASPRFRKNLRFLRSSRVSKALPLDASARPHGASQRSPKNRAVSSNTPQTLPNASTPQGIQGGGQYFCPYNFLYSL